MSKEPREAAVSLSLEAFLRRVVSEFGGIMQSVIGLDEASGLVALVAGNVGEWIGDQYAAAGVVGRTPDEVGAVLVDLKRRIGGGFRVQRCTDQEIVLVNARCPFGEEVLGKPALCQMTTNVFGRVTADSLGYARVRVDKAIARGDGGCRVVVGLSAAKLNAGDMEFFRVL